MNKEIAVNMARGFMSRLGFRFQKYAPEICLVGGSVAVVAGTILACKATLELPDILDETKKEIDNVKSEPKTDEDRSKGITKAYIRCGLKITKKYALPVALEAGGLGLIFGGHKVLKDRNTKLALAYTTLDKAFAGYRKRVEEKYGTEEEKDIRYDAHKEEITEQQTDAKGKTKDVKKTIRYVNGYDGDELLGPYARCFCEGCNGWVDDPDLCRQVLAGMERVLTARLRTQGYLWLNDVFDALGFPRTGIGHQIGWVYNPSDPTLENHVSFDITNLKRKSVRDFANGYENVVWLDFNPDGLILDKAIKLGWLSRD